MEVNSVTSKIENNGTADDAASIAALSADNEVVTRIRTIWKTETITTDYEGQYGRSEQKALLLMLLLR